VPDVPRGAADAVKLKKNTAAFIISLIISLLELNLELNKSNMC